MKKVFMIFCLLFVLNLCLFAGFGIGISGGWTSVAMKDVNENYFEKLVNGVESIYALLGGSATSSVNKISGGYSLGVDFLYSPFSFLSLGIRTGFISAGGSFKTTGSIFSASVITDGTLDTTLVPLAFGLLSEFAIPNTEIIFGTGVFAGLCFAGTQMKYNINFSTTNSYGTINASGTDLFIDIFGKILYKPLSFLSFGIQPGYRIANVKEMKVTESNVTNVNKGDIIKDSENNPIEFDYSGFSIQALVLFSF
jgi:hypothetical protein